MLWLLIAAVSLAGCDSSDPTGTLSKLIPWLHQSPSERYLAELSPQQARLWQASLDAALQAPLIVNGNRYAETGRFSAALPRAEAFQLSLSMGEQLRIAVRTPQAASSVSSFEESSNASYAQSAATTALFAEVYERDEEAWNPFERIEINSTAFVLDAQEPRELMLVLQPQLDAEVTYELEISQGGSLFIPVEGATHRSMGGGFGVPRDGGRRVHHGVDIFAKRGTPIYAVADGWVSTGDTRIGGKVVWLRPMLGGVSYYYAHLDSIGVSTGERVKRGDYLGTVGNTGNAVSTPPHLHFGIYKRGTGPVDPAPFLSAPPAEEFEHVQEFPLQHTHRVVAERLNLREAPSATGKVVSRLQRGNAVQTLATSGADWVRILTEDGTGGFVHSDWLEAVKDSRG